MRNHNIHNMSPEDKQKWCELGMKYEIDFIENIAPLCNLHLDIHPEKKNGNIYYMDLIDLDSKLPVDLKRQETPFFTAQKKYGIDPQYAITFNKKDYENYMRNYPNAKIIWWITWQQLTGYGVTVAPLDGVWICNFKDMASYIQNGDVPLHSYQWRRHDPVNANDSYVFRLTSPIFYRLL